VGTRVYRLKMPDNPTLPAITYETSLGEQIESFDGFSNLSNPIISIHAWSNSVSAARTIINLVRDAIIGKSWTYGDVTVQNVLEWTTTDLYDSDTEIYHVSARCRFWY
jgi:hypothetical protein